MAIRTYGELIYKDKLWQITKAEPHVWIKLKNIFQKIPKAATKYSFIDTPENCFEILWFMQRYPLALSTEDTLLLEKGKETHIEAMNATEAIFLPGYMQRAVSLKAGQNGRNYQLQANDLSIKVKRYLLGDDLGTGKTITGILTCLSHNKPCLVTVPVHLVKHWESRIASFTDMTSHVIKKTTPYNLPDVDVYIITYSKLAGWVNVLPGLVKHLVFDEAQELRHNGSQRYNAAKAISDSAESCLTMSATPIYNYGGEIYNVLDVTKPECLGNRDDFYRERCVYKGNNRWIVKDTEALGMYLRESFLMLRRTKADCKIEIPLVSTMVETVDYDTASVASAEKIAKMLATRVRTGSFMERGQAARELDIMVRLLTGVSKAKYVAEYVKMILENGEPVLLGGWHHDVYAIWAECLKDYNPAWFTGTETPAQKESSLKRFLNGETNILIMSLRSGLGVDGLQYRCSTAVIGELDWSPKVHEQFTGRLVRDGQKNPVTIIYPVSEWGSDPLIVDLLALKSSQSHGIMNPSEAISEQYTDESRIKLLAERFLKK